MKGNIETRLAKLEKVTPPEGLQPIFLVAADDPEAERLMAEYEGQSGLEPLLIILTGVHRSPEGLVR